MVSLTDAERDSLTECECGHFANEHSGAGCLATAYDGDDGMVSDDDVCPCTHSPTAINRHAVEAIVAARVEAERDRLLARIEELADGFHDHAQASRSLAYLDVWQSATRQLRALVAEERAR